MTIHKIEVSEYECIHCGYKWINRVNGKDGPVPKNCAKCKRLYWNGKQGYDPITANERSMRMRLHKFEGTLNRGLGHGTQYRPNELCEKFLNLNPRPTIGELREALWPLGWNPHEHKNFIPDPDRPGYLKYESPWILDKESPDYVKRKPDTEYQKLLREETEKRRKFIKKVIKSRGENVPKEKTDKQLMDEERTTGAIKKNNRKDRSWQK